MKQNGCVTVTGFYFPFAKPKRVVPAGNFLATVAVNVDNKGLSDEDFRKFIRDTLPVVQYEGCEGE